MYVQVYSLESSRAHSGSIRFCWYFGRERVYSDGQEGGASRHSETGPLHLLGVGTRGIPLVSSLN
jgi:hypothetical protein